MTGKILAAKRSALSRSATSFVERPNLSLRQRVAAIGRRSATSCKSEAGLGQPLALFQAYYNFVLSHTSLRLLGTGAGFCTVVSVPPEDTLEECLLTAIFAEGQIIFGGIAPLAEVGAVAYG